MPLKGKIIKNVAETALNKAGKEHIKSNLPKASNAIKRGTLKNTNNNGKVNLNKGKETINSVKKNINSKNTAPVGKERQPKSNTDTNNQTNNLSNPTKNLSNNNFAQKNLPNQNSSNNPGKLKNPLDNNLNSRNMLQKKAVPNVAKNTLKRFAVMALLNPMTYLFLIILFVFTVIIGIALGNSISDNIVVDKSTYNTPSVKLGSIRNPCDDRVGGSGSGFNYNRIFILGDSRMCQVYHHIHNPAAWETVVEDRIVDDEIWFSYGGKGIAYYRENQIPYVDRNVQEGDAIFIWMGVNNPDSYNEFIELTNSKAKEWRSKGAEVFYGSIGATWESGVLVPNSKVKTFNEALKNNLSSDVHYVECMYDITLSEGDSGMTDGTHYNESICKKIYEGMKKAVKTGYCTSSTNSSKPGYCDDNDKKDDNSTGTGYVGGAEYNSANETQKKVVDTGINSDSVCLIPDRCLQFVQDVFDQAGSGIKRYCCAHAAMDASNTSSDLSNIPVGACVFSAKSNPYVPCGCGRDAGHVCIYIGDGKVVENIGGRSVGSLEDWVGTWGGPGTVQWGWLGGVDLSKK